MEAPSSPSGPPSWVITILAVCGSGFLILTGNCKRLSYDHINYPLLPTATGRRDTRHTMTFPRAAGKEGASFQLLDLTKVLFSVIIFIDKIYKGDYAALQGGSAVRREGSARVCAACRKTEAEAGTEKGEELPLVKFEHVSLSYGSQQVIFDLSFEIPDNRFAILIGPSGCGKTTTLKMINRLIQPDSGRIFVDGKDIAQEDKVELRRRIGYVIQQIGLFPNMTVAQNICVVPRLLKYPKDQCEQIVRDMLAMVDMPYEQYAHKYPSEMSGGQQQRIGILRALAASPPIVLMDEPFSALDPMTRRTLQQEMKSLQQKLNKTIVFVTHDMEEALDLADLIIFMNHGRIEQMATPEEMLAHPATGLIHDFLGKHMPDSAAADLKVKSANKKSIGEWRKMMKRKRAYQKRPDGKMRWPDRKICIKECYS